MRSNSPFARIQSTGNLFDETAQVEELGVRQTKIMFGDVFQTRADYTKGTYYMGKRIFLKDPENGGGINDERWNPLQPTPLYMTRKQMRKHRHKNDTVSTFKKLDFNSGGGMDDPKSLKAALHRKQEALTKKKSRPPTTIILEKYSSLDPSEWQETHQAGCKFYVNHKTGEVATEKPWDIPKDNEEKPQSEAIVRQIGFPCNSQSRRNNSVPSPTSWKHANNACKKNSRTTSNWASFSHGPVSGINSSLLNISNISRNEDSFIVANATAITDIEVDLNENGNDANNDSEISEGNSIIEEGTGSHLYDGSEIMSFFEMLDAEKKSSSRSKRK